MSRVPRSTEHLKTGFSCEAAAAAKFRAYARAAQRVGMSELSARWLALAVEKDELAMNQLEAAGQVREPARAVADALAEERYENEVLYPKMIRELGNDDAVEIMRTVVETQERHAKLLGALRSELQASRGDVA